MQRKKPWLITKAFSFLFRDYIAPVWLLNDGHSPAKKLFVLIHCAFTEASETMSATHDSVTVAVI